MKKQIVHTFAFCFLCTSLVWGQGNINYTHALKVELGLPITQTNKAYKEFTQGIGYTNINYQYRLFKNDKVSPIMGLGISSNYMMVQNFKINNFNSGGLLSYGGFGKIGVEIRHDENIFVDYHVKGGYYFMHSRNKQGTTTNESLFIRDFQHFYIEPGINFTVMVNETSGFSFNTSYTFRDMKFKAHHLAIAELPGFVTANLNGIASHLNFAFGYTLYINKKSKSTDF
jgi:hypothetical protein